jgi:hypothetical protein
MHAHTHAKPHLCVGVLLLDELGVKYRACGGLRRKPPTGGLSSLRTCTLVLAIREFHGETSLDFIAAKNDNPSRD